MPSIQITTDPDPTTGGDPMEERTDVDYDDNEDVNNDPQSSASAAPGNFPSPPSRQGSADSFTKSSPPSPPPIPPNNPAPATTLRLAEVDRTINFEVDPLNSARVSGRLYIKNVTVPGRPLIFKIKTTAQKFHVWPAIGLIAGDESGGGLSSPKVTVKPGVSLASIVDERFKVQVMIVPIGMLNRIQNIEDEDQRGNADPEGRGRRSSLVGEPGHSRSTFEDLSRMWENIWRADPPREDHRVSVILTDHSTHRRMSSDNNEFDMSPPLQSAPPLPLPPPPPPLPDQLLDDWSSWTRRMDGLESKLDEIDEFISEQLSFVQLLLYILMGMVCSFTIILFVWGGGTMTMTTASSVGSALNYLKSTAVTSVSPNSEQQQQQQQNPGLTLSSLVGSLVSAVTGAAGSLRNPATNTNTKFNIPPSSIVVQEDNIFAGASPAASSQPPPPPPPPPLPPPQQQQPFYSFETSRFEYSSSSNNIPPRVPRRPPLCPMFG